MCITIMQLQAEQNSEVARMLARAFVTNPINVTAFGSDQLARNEAFFRMGLRLMNGTKLVAMNDAQVIGFMHWARAPQCQAGALDKIKAVPRMLGSFGMSATLRAMSWLGTWEKCDPPEPHGHLGPIGVDPQSRRRRVGQLLMERYCEELDRENLDGYLETDRPENLSFYQKFGFVTTTSVPALGITNYLMLRKSR